MAMATFIACLGQQLAPDGSVPLTLANRAARAAQLHKTLGASIILSGADVSKVGITEAQAMKRILSSAPYSVAPEALLLDESAQNTIENARNTLSIIREHTSGIDSGIKMYLVTSEFHCPRSEFIFRNVFEAEGALEVTIEAAAACSGLADDISTAPHQEMLTGFKFNRMKDINEWGIFRRLCHEHALMMNKMTSELSEYGVEQQNPVHFSNATNQILELIEKARQGHFSNNSIIGPKL
ncbi:Catechol O-methyltransferase [Durusdinium trenchii]|uniref:Catechol O-methyltransferase n=1 Tax=Durusdinium trenchii TaxID=1381693 RepID=A0ABP0L8U4_9DINO